MNGTIGQAGPAQCILKSAKGLARDTFSANLGMQYDLRDASMPGKQGRILHSPRNGQSTVLHQDYRNQRRNTVTSSSYFRSTGSKEQAAVAELEFDDFESRTRSGDLIDWSTWDLARSTCSEGHDDARSTDNRTEDWPDSLTTINAETKCDARKPTSSCFDQAYCRRDNCYRNHQSPAVRRLNQVWNHFQERVIEVPDFPVSGPLDTTHYDTEHANEIKQGFDDRLREFNCSNLECHYKLALLNAGMLGAESCAHDGCCWKVGSADELLHHILATHHSGHSLCFSVDPASFWSDYDSSVTQHFGEHW